MSQPSAPTTVQVNGFAVREWRIERGLEMPDLAEVLGVGRPYVNKIELGHSVKVSPSVFRGLVAALGIRDRRALMANPHASLQDQAAA